MWNAISLVDDMNSYRRVHFHSGLAIFSLIDKYKKRDKKYRTQTLSKHTTGVAWITAEIKVSEFEFQSCSYVHFRTNILRKGMEPT